MTVLRHSVGVQHDRKFVYAWRRFMRSSVKCTGHKNTKILAGMKDVCLKSLRDLFDPASRANRWIQQLLLLHFVCLAEAALKLVSHAPLDKYV